MSIFIAATHVTKCDIGCHSHPPYTGIMFVYHFHLWIKISVKHLCKVPFLAMDVEENYLISQAKLAQSTDPNTAKAWILTAKALYPNNFGVQVGSITFFDSWNSIRKIQIFQFEAYLIEKAANNYEEAAKCLSYMWVNCWKFKQRISSSKYNQQSDDVPKPNARIMERSDPINIRIANTRRWNNERARFLCQNVPTHLIRSATQNPLANCQSFRQQFGSLQIDVVVAETISTNHTNTFGKKILSLSVPNEMKKKFLRLASSSRNHNARHCQQSQSISWNSDRRSVTAHQHKSSRSAE